jgi:hypothetical protein
MSVCRSAIMWLKCELIISLSPGGGGPATRSSAEGWADPSSDPWTMVLAPGHSVLPTAMLVDESAAVAEADDSGAGSVPLSALPRSASPWLPTDLDAATEESDLLPFGGVLDDPPAPDVEPPMDVDMSVLTAGLESPSGAPSLSPSLTVFPESPSLIAMMPVDAAVGEGEGAPAALPGEWVGSMNR